MGPYRRGRGRLAPRMLQELSIDSGTLQQLLLQMSTVVYLCIWHLMETHIKNVYVYFLAMNMVTGEAAVTGNLKSDANFGRSRSDPSFPDPSLVVPFLDNIT